MRWSPTPSRTGSSAASPRNGHGNCPNASQPLVPSTGFAGSSSATSRGTATSVPLEALRAVDREDLHRARLRILGARREVFALLGLAQPGEEAAQLEPTASPSRRARGSRRARRRTPPSERRRAGGTRSRRPRCRAAAPARRARPGRAGSSAVRARSRATTCPASRSRASPTSLKSAQRAVPVAAPCARKSSASTIEPPSPSVRLERSRACTSSA